MRKGILLFLTLLLVPSAIATAVGTGIGIDIQTEDFKPLLWMCDSRCVMDDNVQTWRSQQRCDEVNHVSDSVPIAAGPCPPADRLFERFNNYAFEGEKIAWNVLVYDKNGIEKVKDVWVSIGPDRDARSMVTYEYEDPSCMQDCSETHNECETKCIENCTTSGCDCEGGYWLGDGWEETVQDFPECENPTSDGQCVTCCQEKTETCDDSCMRTGQRLEANEIQANCHVISRFSDFSEIPASCNARILEEEVTHVSGDVAAMYRCELTVETPISMYGEYFVTIEAEDLDGLYNHADEVEYWFFNPVIELFVDGDLTFEEVRPGTSAYSSSLLVGNDADDGSGVMMDMFISGTDFYDSSSSGAMCPTTNQLSLQNFRYWSVNGGYSTSQDPRRDQEGYVGIGYGDHWDKSMYDVNEIIQAGPSVHGTGLGYQANVLTPGSELPITFRVDVPEPCNGDFDTGAVYFWGEAI